MQTNSDSVPSSERVASGPFPESAPGSVSSPESIRQNDWEAFCGVDTMEDHWSRSVWAAGQETYFWYLTFDNPELSRAAEQCQLELGAVGLDHVPSDGLHLTLSKIGNADRVRTDQIGAIVEAARNELALIKPFDLSVGPLAGSRGAIRFSVSPWSEILDIHRAATSATLDVIPDLRIADTKSFRPHIGIAYSNRRQTAKPLISSVSRLRDLTPIDVRVESVEIVRLRRESNAYRWTNVESFQLGSS
ncbi:2'-5' RNA ligase family protein [Nocardia sp. NPDC005978]|uniref:2'-5' RNA ligase family protein n=1 Tax=Nocardia sp. NPDC005978 TaxID=3156725 RepID=UPI0033B1E607